MTSGSLVHYHLQSCLVGIKISHSTLLFIIQNILESEIKSMDIDKNTFYKEKLPSMKDIPLNKLLMNVFQARLV